MRLRGRSQDPAEQDPPLPGTESGALEAEAEAEQVVAMSAVPVVVVGAVNLLPHTYAERAAVRKAQLFALCAVIVGVLAAALLWLIAYQNAMTAQEKLDEATAARARLQAEAARYAGVPLVFQQVATAEEQMRIAMGNEVRWSFFLNDLALIMPKNVALESMQATSLAPGAAPESDAQNPASIPTVGTWTVSGKAQTYNDVAKWLDVLSRTATLADPTVGALTQTKEEATQVVSFTSQADLTTTALSGRYAETEEAAQ